MSLRINSSKEGKEGDDLPARLAKLIPAEALSLYGSGTAIIGDDEGSKRLLIFLAAACFLLAIAIRWKATKGDNGKPQVAAVAIAAISFVLWCIALQPPVGFLDWSGDYRLPGLLALMWATIVPIFYKGDPK